MDEDRLHLRWDYEEVKAILSQDHREIDEYISLVKKKHRAARSGLEERMDLLNQYVRLPALSPKARRGSAYEYGPEAMSERHGEILVTFYTQDLRKDDSADDDDDEEDPDEEQLRTFAHMGGRSLGDYVDEDEFGDEFPRDKTAPTYFAVPLQYMCKVKKGEGRDEPPVRLVMDFDKIPLRPGSETSGKLRIIEFPTTYYAEEFLHIMREREVQYPVPNPKGRQKKETIEVRNAMANLSLKRFMNNPKVAMIKLRGASMSRFLAGVSYHPNMPRNKNPPHKKRGSFLPGTVLFVAIPYLGLEKLARVSFRKKLEASRGPFLPGEEQTALHLTDNTELASVSTLSLFEYNFPRKLNTPLFDKTQTKIGDNCMVVHQVWFMVFDNETIAAFRSANDNHPEHIPLSPHHHSYGAYHTLINMIDNILPSWELSLLDDIRDEISELEYSMQSGNVDELAGLIDILYTMRTELSTIVTVVDLQITILRRLKKFDYSTEEGQFKIMRKAIDKVIKSRKTFQTDVETMVNRLKYLQVAKQDRLKYQMMINTARMQENTGLTLEDVAYQQAVVQKLQQQLQIKQDVRMTVFTSVTVVFLPLSFFTSYFGMNVQDIRETTWTQRRFWAVCAPVSFFLIVTVLLVALRTKGRSMFSRRLKNIIINRTPESLRRRFGWRLPDPPTPEIPDVPAIHLHPVHMENGFDPQVDQHRMSMAARRHSRVCPLSPSAMDFDIEKMFPDTLQTGAIRKVDEEVVPEAQEGGGHGLKRAATWPADRKSVV